MEEAREHVVRFVRRARARLAALRLVRGTARGALAGSAAGVLLLLSDKVLAAVRVAPAVPWLLLAGGALAGLAMAASRPAIRLAETALLLDARLGTRERLATVLTCPPGPFVARVAGELGAVGRLPRFPLPREASWVPAALFLLFAAGLLPAAGAAPPGTATLAPAPAAAVESAAEPGPDALEVAQRLEAGTVPTGGDEREARDSIERTLTLPEEREAAHAALDRAVRGDGASAREVARSLREATGGARTGGATADPVTVGAGSPEGHREGVRAAAYPGMEAFLIAYRRALALDEEKDR